MSAEDPELVFTLLGLSDRAVKALLANGFTDKDHLLNYMGRNPRKLLQLKGIGKSVYEEILEALNDIRLKRAEERYQKGKAAKLKYQRAWEEKLLELIAEEGLGGVVTQYKFLEGRRYSFDIAFPDCLLAVEVDGGTHMKQKGGHNSGAGYESDRLKDQEALLLDWVVYRVTPNMITSGHAIRTIKALISKRKVNK